MAIAMSILLCSLLGLLLTTMNYPRTFSREIKKHWVAYNRETGKPLVNLIRKNAKDVVWDEVNVFELTIEKFKNFEDGEPYAIMRDEQQRAFKMSFEHLGKISHLFINGKLHGKFHLVAYSSDQMLYYIEEKS
jgi:hypothetical protein